MDAPLRALVPVVLAGLVAFVAARAQAQAPPPASQSTPAPSYQVGDHLEVRFQGSWYRATVVEVIGSRWVVSYDGYSTDWNQLVGADRLRVPAPPPPPPPPGTPPGTPVAHVGRLGPGTNVLVEWHGTWYPARVLRALGAALVRIRYVGSGREWDEAVDATRVRMPAKN